MPTLYLKKLNNDFVSHCACDDTLVSSPAQMDCPWCGCGWLFTCLKCGKAFTFARATMVDESFEELARRDLHRKFGDADAEAVAQWVDWMQLMLNDVQVGRNYVYLDGYYLDTESSPVSFEGLHAWHELPDVPQVATQSDPTIGSQILENERYWTEHAVAEPDA